MVISQTRLLKVDGVLSIKLSSQTVIAWTAVESTKQTEPDVKPFTRVQIILSELDTPCRTADTNQHWCFTDLVIYPT